MAFFMRLVDKQMLTTFGKHWPWFMVMGVVLLILGIVAITYATTTTLISVVILGGVLAIAGIAEIIDAFKFWGSKGGGFFLRLIMGILYLLVGISLIRGPLVGAVSITMLLAIFYIVIGVFRFITALTTSLPGRGWMIFSGIIGILLGILILLELPVSGLFIIGLFVGIDLIVSGWMYIMAAITARGLTKEV